MAEATEPLVHIGLHKTGSTWLQNQVFATERFGYTMVDPRTLIDQAWVAVNDFRFDPAEAAACFQPFAEQAERNGTKLVISHERLSSLPLMGAVDARQIADRIAATYPGARILIVIREQQDIILSVYKQHITQFGRESFESVWRQRTVAEQRRPGPRLDVFEYHDIIEYYQRLFGADRVLVRPFELLRADPLRFVTDIATFAGAPVPTTVPSDAENEALPAASVAFVRYLNIAMRVVGLGSLFTGPVAERRGQRIRLAVLLRIGRFMPRRFSRRVNARWRATIERVSKGAFAESNRRTMELTGLDLASYGYEVSRQPAATSPQR